MKLPKCKADVVNVNARKEKHGEDNELAVDVKMTVRGKPELLDAFDPTLRPSFFFTEKDKDHIPRHPEITEFGWGRIFEDAAIQIAGQTYEKVKLHKFAFTCREGGVVSVTFTAAWLPDVDDVGPLAELIKEPVDVEFVTQFDLVDGQKEPEKAAA